MMQFIMIICSITLSFLFMQMKHPLSMGLTLLMQTFLICIITGTFSKTFWFSYILFLIFLGGMLVLFIYVTALASNEMFSLSTKLMLLAMTFIITMSCTIMFLDTTMISSLLMNIDMQMINNLYNFIPENTINLNKLYNFPTNIITLMLINYLLLTLIVAVKITNNFSGPLRTKN